jgi:hypothetical protein
VIRLKLQLVGASVAAASVVFGAVICAKFGQAVLAAALAVYALGAGAWLYHAVERYVVAKRLSTVRSAAKPLLPVMAAIIGLTQAVVRALSDVAELQPQRREVPVWRLVQITRGNGRNKSEDE